MDGDSPSHGQLQEFTFNVKARHFSGCLSRPFATDKDMINQIHPVGWLAAGEVLKRQTYKAIVSAQVP